MTHSVRIDTFLDVSCRLIYEHQCSGGTSFFDSRIAVTQSDSAITTITCKLYVRWRYKPPSRTFDLHDVVSIGRIAKIDFSLCFTKYMLPKINL